MLGYDLDVGGNSLEATLYWRAGAATPPGQQIFVHVLDSAGELLAQSDGAPYGGLYPPDAWLPDEIVRDSRTLVIPPGAVPATIAVGLYDLDTLARLPVTGGSANGAGDGVVISLNAQP